MPPALGGPLLTALSAVADGVVGLAVSDPQPSGPDAVELPAPVPASEVVELWPAFAVVAGVLWLLGWWRRGLRRDLDL